MQERPLIGVIGCNKQVEGEPGYSVKARYVDAIAKYAEAVPLIIPPLGNMDDAGPLVSRLDAILLTGSNSNIQPARYRMLSQEGREPFDSNRDITSIALVKAARHFAVPVIGVCRGLQEINVALGGTIEDERDLEQDPGYSHHAPAGSSLEEDFTYMHPASISPGSVMARIAGDGAIDVNSVHYQHIKRLGEGLQVIATAHDGTIEAISSREAMPQILAVQWHPEWQPESQPHYLAFWRHVGEMARGAAARKIAAQATRF